MDKTHVAAPALITRDLLRLVPAGGCFPEDLEIHVVIAQIAKRLAELASANPAVEVDDGGRFSCRARHRPAGRLLQILKLNSMMKRESADVDGFLNPFYQSILVIEHSFRVAPLNVR